MSDTMDKYTARRQVAADYLREHGISEEAYRAGVAAERERLAEMLRQAEYIIGAFERGADPAEYGRDIDEFRANVSASGGLWR